MRATLNTTIYESKQQLSSGALAGITAEHPVTPARLQSSLDPSELLNEYVLIASWSYAIAVTPRADPRVPAAAEKRPAECRCAKSRRNQQRKAKDGIPGWTRSL